MMASPEVQTFLTEFRENLELFYQCLHLAPPYDSVEKALSSLATRLHEQTTEKQHLMSQENTMKREFFLDAIRESGLNKKHRGIIAGILREQDPTFPPESIRYLKEPFLPSK